MLVLPGIGDPGRGRQMILHRSFFILALAAALAGCSSSSTLSRYTYDSPEAAREAADIYLDGTRAAAEAAEQAETRRQAARTPRLSAQTRADDLSARTTGSRSGVQNEPLKPYSEEWWEREKREDARLKQRMNICRGC